MDKGKAYYVTNIAYHIWKLLLEKLRYVKATSSESEEAACDCCSEDIRWKEKLDFITSHRQMVVAAI